MFLYNPVFPRQTLVNIEVKQNTFPFHEENAFKTTGLTTPGKDNPLKGLNLVSKPWAELTLFKLNFCMTKHGKHFCHKGIARSNPPWTDSEVVPHDVNILTDYRGHCDGEGGKWDSDILGLVSGLAAGFPAHAGTNRSIWIVVSWLKKINHILWLRSSTGGRTYLSLLSPARSKDRAKYGLRQWKLAILSYLCSKAKSSVGKFTVISCFACWITLYLMVDRKWWNDLTCFNSKFARGSSFRHLSHVSHAQAVSSYPVSTPGNEENYIDKSLVGLSLWGESTRSITQAKTNVSLTAFYLWQQAQSYALLLRVCSSAIAYVPSSNTE